MPETVIPDKSERNTFLAAIVDATDDAIISKDLQGYITSWNAGAQHLLGYDAGEIVGRNVMLLIPQDHAEEEPEILARIARGERLKHFETVRLRKDGSRVDVSLTVSPIFDAGGRIIGASKILRDITERKQAEEAQQRLIDEINHRVKNTLVTVQAMAEQTMRTARDPSHFVESFRGRIQALATTHVLLTDQKWSGVSLRALIKHQTMLGAGDMPPLALNGIEVFLGASVAVHLGLVLHELATNARQHGALATQGGSVKIDWRVVEDGGHRRLAIDWTETGGLRTIEPSARGFGMELIERGMRHSLGGDALITFTPAGVICRLSLPLG